MATSEMKHLKHQQLLPQINTYWKDKEHDEETNF